MTADAFVRPVEFPSPTTASARDGRFFVGYLGVLSLPAGDKSSATSPAAELTRSILPSGWTPIELLKHLQYVENRWLEWGFDGQEVANPWAEDKDGRWYVGAEETLEGLIAALAAQAERSTRSSGHTASTKLASLANAGLAPTPRRWSGSCSTCCRSTPGTSATSTLSPNWSPARPVSRQRHSRSVSPGVR